MAPRSIIVKRMLTGEKSAGPVLREREVAKLHSG